MKKILNLITHLFSKDWRDMYTKKTEKNYYFYYEDRCQEAKVLADSFIRKEYKILKPLQKKDTREVSLIEINDTKYILKMEKGMGIIDFLTRSKGRITLHNALLLKKKGFNKAYDVKIAAERKKGFFVSESYFISRYVEGSVPTSEDYKGIMDLLLELHSLGHYHGDAKPKNFVKTDKGIIIIDSKLNKKFTWLGVCKDVVRFQKRTKERLDLNTHFSSYKKHLSYYLAILLIYKKKSFRGTNILKEVLG